MDTYVFNSSDEDIKAARFVQALNPKTGRYVKVDRMRGKVVGYKKTEGPYRNLPLVDNDKGVMRASKKEPTLKQFRSHSVH